jgi:SagB-type dehydrogenase family enzyme
MVELPEPRRRGTYTFEELVPLRRSVRRWTGESLTLSELGQLLWAAYGVTGPGPTSAAPSPPRRAVPSGFALYPLELRVMAGAVEDLEPGTYRYVPERHALGPLEAGDRREGAAAGCPGQEWVGGAPVLLLLAGREAGLRAKVGDLAPAILQYEVGHVAEHVHLQAAALELGTVIIGAFEAGPVSRVFSLPEDLRPHLLMPAGRPAPDG